MLIEINEGPTYVYRKLTARLTYNNNSSKGSKFSRNRLITLDSSHNGILDEREECYKVFVGYIRVHSPLVLLNFDPQ